VRPQGRVRNNLRLYPALAISARFRPLREVKHTGDGIMAAFNKVANAVNAAADIQRRFSVYNAEASLRRLDLAEETDARACGLYGSQAAPLCGGSSTTTRLPTGAPARVQR
jgi:hypothetical protein